MDKLLQILSLLCWSLVISGVTTAVAEDPGDQNLLIKNVVVIDGTGARGFPGAVRVIAGHITRVGDLSPGNGETVVDGGGQVLAPGFIDTHSHADMQIRERREALAAVGQGITTVIIGQDGTSPYPLVDWFKAQQASPAAINIAAYAGHNTIRNKVMGDDFRRAATPEQIQSMAKMLESRPGIDRQARCRTCSGYRNQR